MTTIRLSLSLFVTLALALPTHAAGGDPPMFQIPGQIHAVADETSGTVTLFVEPGTPVTELAPTIGLPDGYVISPGSGEPQDFTDSVTYVVRGDDRSREWRVRVLVKKRSPVLDFDGENAHVRTEVDMLEHVAAHEAFSLSLWFFPRDRKRRQHLISQGARFRIDYRPESDRLEFRFATEGHSTRTVSDRDGTIIAGTWLETVAVFDAAGEPSVAGLLALLTDMSDWQRFVATAEALGEAAVAGGARRGIVRQFTAVEVRDRLRVELRPAPHSMHRPLLSGVEVVWEEPEGFCPL